VIESLEEIATLRLAVAVCAGELESFTCTVNDELPEDDGVPEIAPDDEVSDSPAGNEPLEIDQLYGVAPPLAESVLE